MLASKCSCVVAVVLVQAQPSPDAAQQLAPGGMCFLLAPLTSSLLSQPAQSNVYLFYTPALPTFVLLTSVDLNPLSIVCHPPTHPYDVSPMLCDIVP